MTYQKLQESKSPDLVVTDFGGRCGQGLVLCVKACDDDTVDIQYFCFWYWGGLGKFNDIFGWWK